MDVPPILCYHKVDTRLELGVTRLGPSHFRRQVATLAALGFHAMDTGALRAHLESRDEGGGVRDASGAPSSLIPRPSPLVLTFDDGYEGLDRHAFPVLAEHGMRAVVFVITDYVGRDNDWDVRVGGRSFPHLGWDALGRWQERGIEIQVHGATHRRLTWLSDAEVADDLGRAREAIRHRLGVLPTALAYPFGAVDDRVRRLAAQAGFTLGFAGPRGGAAEALRLPRLPVYPWDRAGVPCVMQAGALGALARWGGRTTNRIAVITPVLQQLMRRR